MTPKASPCNTCGTSIYWGRWLEAGSWMPVDAEPDMRDPPPRGPGGNLVLFIRAGELRIDRYQPTEHGLNRNRYVSHFATCPQAAQHRRSS